MDKKIDIEKAYANKFLWDEPIEYIGIRLYPVQVKDIQNFTLNICSLVYDPLRYNSMISALPRLYFLTDILNHQEDAEYLKNNVFLIQMYTSLICVLEMVLKDQKFQFVKNKNRWFLRVKADSGKDVDIRAKDFDTIREIILHQNGIDYDDAFIHEDIRKWIEEQERAEKNFKIVNEDYLNMFMLRMEKSSMAEIAEMSLRRFYGIIDKLVAREKYFVEQFCYITGKTKTAPKHWISPVKTSVYEKYFKEVK